MNRLLYPALFITGQLFAQIGAAQNHANTIERDKDNPCIIRITVQIGVIGTDADVTAIQNDLNACYSLECFIPCELDPKKGCKVMLTAVVKKWNSLKPEEKDSYHQVTMMDNDGIPSNAGIGTANGAAQMGEWRRDEPPHTYCHETMHFLGLRDKYCDRRYDPVHDTSVAWRRCDPPPDPAGGNCCTATAERPRCGLPCEGHENDLMATLMPGLSCQNILDVLAIAGFNSCPEACCTSSTAFNTNEFFIAPSYLHFGDKDYHFGAYGVSFGYTYKVSPKLGLTIDLGYYGRNHEDSLSDEGKTKSSIYTFGLGLNYYTNLFGSNSKLDLSAHAYLGMMKYKSEYTLGGNNYSTSKSSFCPNLGAALNYNLNAKWEIRLIQADYMPTFFFSGTQNNYRLSVGLGLRW